MQTKNKPISNNTIHFIQLQLFDFIDEKPNFKKTLNKRLNQESSLSNDYSLELDENNTFKYINPTCPKCGSHKIIKKGTITKNKQNILEKSVEFKEQQYQCKNYNKKFGIKNKALFDDNKYFFKQITDKLPEIMKKGYNSLRNIKSYFKIFLNINVSHTTIKNWLKIDENTLIINKKAKYSGYYLYDEQFLRLNGKRHYRLTIFESVYEIRGCKIIATTRNNERINKLSSLGADYVVIDDGNISEKVKEIYLEGVDKILELVGPQTLNDSFKALKKHGICCVTGILGNKELIENFDPNKDVPNAKYLTSFFSNYPNQEIIDNIFEYIINNNIKPQISRVYTSLEDISKAHELMESNTAQGKIIIKLKDF